MINSSQTYRWQRAIIQAVLVLALAWLQGCASYKEMRDPPSYRPTTPPQVSLPASQNGAIYQSGFESRLFEDIKARRVGDILTIVLVESTSASKSASTTTKKDTSLDMPNPTFFGSVPQFNVPGFVPLASNKKNTLEQSLETKQAFTGEGDSSQSNSLSGKITVTINDVLPNGNLLVRGEKWLKLNQGEEYVQISGIVRPIDIKTDNTVLSSQVADARINYSGRGAVADSNAMGWMSRFFLTKLWPF